MGVEIELKFQVPAHRLAALTRAVATRSAETVHLQARYHDTADGRLARARLAWRVRCEGDQWVQTLKGPGDGLTHRLEHEVHCSPTAHDAPPPANAGLHAGTPAGLQLTQALAGAPVAVVYGTDIQRTKRVVRHEGARIEVALDIGHVMAGDRSAAVCELEMELLAGPVTALWSLARRWVGRFGLILDPVTKSERAQWLRHEAAPSFPARPVVRAVEPALAPGVPVDVARAAMVTSALAHGLPNAAAITAGAATPDHVHQLRVALRRLRSALKALGPADGARDEALGSLFTALGHRRDADVMQATLAPAWAAAEAAGWTRPDAMPETDDATALLATPAVTGLWLDLLALTVPAASVPAAEPEPAWDSVVRPQLRRWRRRARRLATQWDLADTAGRHRLRKQLKRLRYLLEFAAPLLPKRRLRAELARLRPLQESLGHWNDLAVARHHLALRAEPTAAEVFAAGWLAGATGAVDAECSRAVRRWLAADDGLRPADLRC